MNRHVNLSSVLLILFAAVVLSIHTPAYCQEMQLKWDFVLPRSTMGWTASKDVANFKQSGGFLAGEAKGASAQVISPDFKLVPTNDNLIHIVMMSDKPGTAKLYWANTMEEPYGGFKPERSLEFKVIGDNQPHAYTLVPFWKKDGNVIKLRIDPPSGSVFLIDFVRVIRLPTVSSMPSSSWDFYGGRNSWIPVRDIKDEGPVMTMWKVQSEQDGLLLSPALSVDATEAGWFTVRMSASDGSNASVHWVTDQETGSHVTKFPIVSDGQLHTYNVELKTDEKWKGSIVRLALNPADDPAEIKLERIALGSKRQGPAEIVIKTLAPAAADAKAGQPLKITAVLLNNGGEKAKDFNVTLNLPKSVQLSAGQLTQTVKELESGKETTLEWTVTSKDAFDGEVELVVSGKDIPEIKETAKVKWSQSVTTQAPSTSEKVKK